MIAIEVTGTIDAEGNLILDESFKMESYPSKVRVIILFLEEENEPDDTSIEEIKVS